LFAGANVFTGKNLNAQIATAPFSADVAATKTCTPGSHRHEQICRFGLGAAAI
jgi:hypothetical protein